METLFTPQQFQSMLHAYNLAIWPAPVVAYALGVAAIILAVNKPPFADKVIAGILAGFWLWTGGMFYLTFFSEINPAAFLFGALFILQGVMLVIVGVGQPTVRFHVRRDIYGIMGACFALYAAVIYPFLGMFFGHRPFTPLFGIAPCSAIMFTWSMLLWTEQLVPKRLLMIPGLLSLVSFVAVFHLGRPEAIMLPVSAVVTVSMLLYRDRIPHGALTHKRAMHSPPGMKRSTTHTRQSSPQAMATHSINA